MNSNLKIKVKVHDLIKVLETYRNSSRNRYNKELKSYQSYIAEISPKLANRIRKIAIDVENGNLKCVESRYRDDLNLLITNFKLKSKPSEPNLDDLDKLISSLRHSTDEVVVINQQDYHKYF